MRVVVVDQVVSIDAVAHGDHRLQVQAWPPCAAACESIPIGGTCRLRAFAILACPSFPNRTDHHQHAQQFAAAPHPLTSCIGMRVIIALTLPRADRTGRLNPSKQSIWHLLCSPSRGPRRRASTSTTNRNSWIHDILQICTAKLAATCNAAVDVCGAALPSALCVLHTHIREYLQLHSHSACQQRHGLAGPFVAKAVEMAILHRAELWASRHRRRCACVERSGR